MKAYILIAIILAAFASGGGTAWKVQDWRHDAAEKQRIEQEAKEQGIRAQRVDVAAVGHEADKAKLRTEFLTITETVERIVEKPVYRDMCFDTDGLRALSDAIGVAAPASEPASALPRPAASH